MSTKDEVREFLISRRANITPQQAGLPDDGGERRVPGLRREEVAQLAGVSIDYYTRLERGNIRGASESVLNAVAKALRMTEVEREYLFDLARALPGGAAARSGVPAAVSVRTSVRRVLDSMAFPAIVQNPQQDIIAANPVGRAMFAPVFDTIGGPNFARFVFLDPRARDFYVDWPLACRTSAAITRFEAGRDPLNEDLTALIGELSARSPHFRREWARRDVHEHRTGVKAFRHPEVGLVEVAFDVLEMPGEAGLKITTYSPPPGTETAEKFSLLASWAATHDAAHPPQAGSGATRTQPGALPPAARTD
ncbi:helix-turn-helix transcriptional regulator [Streptomyces sp. NPDC015237]|uniref:helix-turn-helix transcriptional regulator n=1 Tax=Streptomyces sp. NPDC015237 TaxID=3364949 RepID=UPI0036FA430E